MGCRRTCTPARHCQRHRNSTGRQRRGDAPGAAAPRCVGPSCVTVAGRSTAMESTLPGAGPNDRPRGLSQVARPQDRASPGAARRPLPARERRLFVASVGMRGSLLSTHSTGLHPAAGQCRGDAVGRPSVRRTCCGHVGSGWAGVHDGARGWRRTFFVAVAVRQDGHGLFPFLAA